MTQHHLFRPPSWRRALVALAVVVGGLSVAPPAFAAVDAGGPYTGFEGQPVAIRGTDTGSGTHTWSSRRAPGGEQDGATCSFADTASLSTTVWCNDDGTFDLILTSSDGSTDTARLTLANVAPTLTAVSSATGNTVGVHAVVTVNVSYRDGDPVDSHRYVIDWGDGTTSRASNRLRLNGTGDFSGSHSYASAGIRTVTVSVFDAHGAGNSATLTLRVVGGSPCARVRGAGRLPHSRHSRFYLAASCGSARAVGTVRLRLAGSGQYASTRLTLLRGRGRAATLAGVGRWRYAGTRAWHPRYRYVISVRDRRIGRDRMNVSVYNPAGVRILHRRGRIAGGYISVRR